ncbi:conjugal transfer pilus assembly protein TraV [Sphingobium sp. AP50]|uniref:TraV family lipoprotein n=1 Tax=Sphingobium sp. AP50 TaxID=1884369 RepID=UPI0008B33382|nr:TraV family lipoprotein [Sphingobium sp. AP50]SEK04107.1 conjugal transfer pilus assembly protein TraV [Sphingobium sp. AP50]
MRPMSRARKLTAPHAVGIIIALASFSGCVGLGGNIKGSFACQAPDGICAPSAVIDDRALAMISDDPSAIATPAGPSRQDMKPSPPQPVQRVAAAQPVRRPVGTDPGRTSEKVLRIIFPAYIDARGRLHEASAVHAVVSQGEWLTWTEGGPVPVRNAVAVAPDMPSLAEAVAGKEASPVEVDPNLPDPTAVAAARARKADPVAAIKTDVEKRLKPSPRTTDPAAAGTNAKPQHAPSANAVPSPAQVERPMMRATSFSATVAEDQ